MSWCKPFAGVVLLLTLSACGFRPLYAPPAEDVSGQSQYAFESLKEVEVGIIADREGQYLRNKLVRLLHPEGKAAGVRYGLKVQFSKSRSDLGVQQSAIATRANMVVSAQYVLSEVGTGRVRGSGSVRSTSGFNIFDSEFQTLVAEQGAVERGLDSIAEQIRIRLAIALTKSPDNETQTR